VAAMEEKLVKHFAGLKNPENAPERIKYDMPGNKEPLIAVVTDKEATQNVVQLFYKHPQKTERTVGDYRHFLLRMLYNNMLNKRFKELVQDPDAPFMYAATTYERFYGPVDVYSAVAVAKNNQINQSYIALLTENERVKRHGFTQSELEREKMEMLTMYDQIAKEADKNNSGSLVEEYIRNFIDEEPLPGPLTENALAQQFIPEITIEDVNQLAQEWVTDENICLIVMAPEKDDLKIPMDVELGMLIPIVKQGEITAFVDQVLDQPLIAETPAGSRVFRRKDNPKFGTTELTFMNGVQVVLKSTDFQNDQILFAGFSPGGTSVYTNEDYMSAMMASGIVSQSGLGDFNQIALTKKLAGSTAHLTPYINDLYEGISGSTAPKDLETMLQLNYLYFTNIRRDEDAFKAYISRIRNQVTNLKSNPMYAYMDTIYKIATSYNPRTIVIPTEKQVDQINLNHAFYIFQDRFADAGDFKFTMVGNFNVNEVIPLLEKYLGGLPSKGRTETWRDVSPKFPQGIVKFDDTRNSEPQSYVHIFMKSDFKWKYKERLITDMLRDILNIKLRESMREDQGGVYGVRLSVDVEPFPKPKFSLTVQWGCAPENAEKLIATVFDEINKIKTDGPVLTDLNKVKETILRGYETELRENSYWLGTLQNVARLKDPLMTTEEYKKLVQSITVKDIKNIACKYINENNYVVGKLLPK
ncbi:MAG: insulinase family protein, partial [Bacteroidales bacterium]|nr:insulinase family protein [Bacteroidales bacterium]